MKIPNWLQLVSLTFPIVGGLLIAEGHGQIGLIFPLMLIVIYLINKSH